MPSHRGARTRLLDGPLVRTLTGLLLVAGLAGCQTGTDDPGVAPDPTPAPTSLPSDEPTDEPADEPEDSVEDGPDDGSGAGDDDAAGTPENGPNAITSPGPGEEVPGPQVTVSGEGTAFEGTLNYRVLDAATGEVVVDVDHTTAGANGEVGPWSVDLTLEPGEYTVEVWEPGMGEEDGDQEDLHPVEVTFTVT